MNAPTAPQPNPAGAPWSLPVEGVLAALQTTPQGLSVVEAARRLKEYGPNAIPEPAPDPLWLRFWRQLTGDAVVRLLLIGGLVCFVPGINDYLEGVAILLMLTIMASFGVWQEGKASDAARSLRKTDNPTKSIFRDGKRIEVGVEEIVPGDVVYLPTGSVTPADGRVISAVNAEKDTAKLTGESHPVEINIDPVPATTVINEQNNMVHRGDAILSGNVTMVVTGTGARTELGKIAARLATTEDAPTPLDVQLEELGDKMAKLFIAMAVLVIGTGAARELWQAFSGTEAFTFARGLAIFKESFINAVALIIAAIPEGLPAVLTITLAIATKTMAGRNAVVRRPKAVEGGGSMTVLLTDKTGTLTAGQMEVNHVWLEGTLQDAAAIEQLRHNTVGVRALRVAKLCNNDGNATETAILRWVDQSAYQPHDKETRATEHDFNQSLKRMSTVHAAEEAGMYRILTKGAPEHVLALCTHQATSHHDVALDDTRRRVVWQAISDLASRGLRVIALADRMLADAHTLSRTDAESELVFVGLIGIMDPPRADVKDAVAKLSAAGVQTVMITGDNPLTAYYVSKMVGIIQGDPPVNEVVMTGEDLTDLHEPTLELLTRLHSVRVFARVTPEHKADIVKALQKDGYIVGMTGDGINDAIALQQSDVGFAMGNGTDVAREASDVVLMDSRFSTIPAAVEEGRNVLHRIRLYLSYILSGNGCELGAFIAAYALGIDIPLTALVLLVINFATDSFPALAMAFEAGEPDVMDRPPRKRGVPFINRAMWLHIGVQTVVATIVIMAVYYYVLIQEGYFANPSGPEHERALAIARSAAFMAYIWQKLYRAFTARSMTESIFKIGFLSNPWTPAAVAISLALGLFFVYVPGVNAAVGMAPLPAVWMGLTAAVGLVCPIAEELTKKFLRKRLDAH